MLLVAAAGPAPAAIREPPAGPAQPLDRLEDLPLEIHPGRAPRVFVLLLSGDGGWQDMDRQITARLNDAGIGVVGLNSFMYFLQKRSVPEISRDLERAVSVYRRRWHARFVGLLGYSFGADVVPFAWPCLSPASKASTRLIALMGPEPTALFEITVMDLLGVTMWDETDIRPAVARLPHARLMCFYGREEREADDTGCTVPEMRGATAVERPGGHHFDENYAPVADMMIERLLPRTRRHRHAHAASGRSLDHRT